MTGGLNHSLRGRAKGGSIEEPEKLNQGKTRKKKKVHYIKVFKKVKSFCLKFQ